MCTHMYKYKHISTCTCTHTHACMHTHTHARTHAHTHTHTPLLTLADESLTDQPEHDTSTRVTFGGSVKRPHDQFMATLLGSHRGLEREMVTVHMSILGVVADTFPHIPEPHTLYTPPHWHIPLYLKFLVPQTSNLPYTHSLVSIPS